MKISKQVFNLQIILLILLFASCKKDMKSLQADGSAENANASSKPNIILIIGDDVGREIPTYNGGQSYSTPNLDLMAANGKQFPYFLAHPDGPPSRLALFTGEYNYRNWVQFGLLPASSQTFANMLRNKGYATCFTGKWQFDGGDSSIKHHGFDNYLVFMPFNPDQNNGHDQYYRRYKNPYLYLNGRHLTDAEVKGKYSEDMFFQYASRFIDSSRSKPFLLVYSHNLVQKPWVPTPDDPGYANWDPATDDATKFDTAYFPGMVAYMDKMIGKLINKVKTAGLSQKTYIIFISDNATNGVIRSAYKGKIVKGAKDSTVFDGINVPMLVYAPGKVVPGADTSLVDMTDFFPTFADIANISSKSYKPLDGVSFYDNISGAIDSTKQRANVYCYWPRDYQRKIDLSYATDYNYKLYDSLNGGKFYNIHSDIYEKHPLTDNQLTTKEKKIKTKFNKILQQAF